MCVCVKDKLSLLFQMTEISLINTAENCKNLSSVVALLGAAPCKTVTMLFHVSVYAEGT